jgi:N-acetyl-anhydromuramyl-L-alanine amidase AmpD
VALSINFARGAAFALFALTLAPCFAAEPQAPEIVSREAWHAAPEKGALMQRQTPKAIVIHHTGERQQPKRTLEQKLRSLQEFSQRPGKVGVKLKPAWGDVPYHYYIDVSGRIGAGRPVEYAGDTNTGYDTSNRLQVVVEGNFETETPSPAQLASLRSLVAWLAAKYQIPSAQITNHSDNAQTDCPGKKLKPFLAELRAAAAN